MDPTSPRTSTLPKRTALYEHVLRVMKANLTTEEVDHVVEVDAFYNLNFYPLTRRAYRHRRWLPNMFHE
jgi:hypothetical protein